MKKPPFQFGLKSIFAVMTIAAVLTAGLVTPNFTVGLIAKVVALWFFNMAFLAAVGFSMFKIINCFRLRRHQGPQD